MFYIEFFIYYLLLINVIAFITYGIDKYKAKHNLWRIPETVLLSLALIGGGVGCWLGMGLFRHKTKHLKFIIGVPAILILQFALLVYIYINY